MPPPASHVVTVISSFLEGGDLAGAEPRINKLAEVLASDMKFEMAGRNFPLACNIRGVDAFKECVTNRMAPYFSTIVENPSFEIVRAVGGGEDPWVAIEFIAKGTTRAGRPYHNNGAAFICFDESGKICEVKGFNDTQHLETCFEECK
jgi:ketosteroid isomerase-like protein